MPNPKLETYKNKATGDVYDYTDADAQGKLTAILDGTTIDSFADVESALADKVDAVAGKGLSTNDYDDTEKAKVAAAFPRSEQAVLGAVNRLNFPAWSKVGISDAMATWDNDTYTLTLTSTSLSGRTNLTVPVDAQIDVQPGQTITFLWDSTGSDDTVMTFDVFKVGETSTTIASASIHENKLTMVVPANCYKLTYRVMSNSANKVIKIANCMCVFGDGTGAVFVPYAMTNKELTEKVFEKGILDASNDLDDIKTTGIYGVGSAPAHSPENLQYYTLIVSKYQTDGQFTQMAIKTGTIYVRRFFYDSGTTTYHWDNWYKFTGTVVS